MTGGLVDDDRLRLRATSARRVRRSRSASRRVQQRVELAGCTMRPRLFGFLHVEGGRNSASGSGKLPIQPMPRHVVLPSRVSLRKVFHSCDSSSTRCRASAPTRACSHSAIELVGLVAGVELATVMRSRERRAQLAPRDRHLRARARRVEVEPGRRHVAQLACLDDHGHAGGVAGDAAQRQLLVGERGDRRAGRVLRAAELAAALDVRASGGDRRRASSARRKWTLGYRSVLMT